MVVNKIVYKSGCTISFLSRDLPSCVVPSSLNRNKIPHMWHNIKRALIKEERMHYLSTELTKITFRSSSKEAKTFCKILVLKMLCSSIIPVSSYLLSWCNAKISSDERLPVSWSKAGELLLRFNRFGAVFSTGKDWQLTIVQNRSVLCT